MNKKTNRMTKIAVTAAIYIIITFMFGAISYGPVQFRIAEAMVLLAFYDKDYIYALTIGCFISNIMGPYGLPDIIFGTAATLISAYAVYFTARKIKSRDIAMVIASLWPTIVNAVFIGYMLKITAGLPFVLSILQVGAGEFVVVTLAGVPLFKLIENKYMKTV